MPPRFLILDDFMVILDCYEDFLTDAFPGAIVKKALNNGEAWLILKDFTPDLIMTDLCHPPGANGLDFLRQLRQDTTKSSIPVICISGNAGVLVGNKEFDAVFKKTTSFHILLDCVKGFLPQINPKTDKKESIAGK